MAFEALRPYPHELITTAAVKDPVLQRIAPYDRVTRYFFANSCGGYEGVQFTSSGSEPARSLPWVIGTPYVSRFRDRLRIELRIEAFEAE